MQDAKLTEEGLLRVGQSWVKQGFKIVCSGAIYDDFSLKPERFKNVSTIGKDVEFILIRNELETVILVDPEWVLGRVRRGA